MRWYVWCGLTSVVVACGQSRSHSGAPGVRGGRDATAGKDGSAALGGSDGGAASGSGGATSSDSGKSSGGERATAGSGAGLAGIGGVGANAGSAGAESGVAGTPAATGGVATGGSGGDGAAGEGGAAPDFACRGLTACGCGCCADSNPKVTCYYPEYGDDLAAIDEADDLASMSPDCETAGCSAGLHYVCCVTPSEAREGKYTASLTVDGRIFIMHEDPNGLYCRLLWLAPSPDGAGDYPNVDLPEGYWLQQPLEAACDDTAFAQGSAGALGRITITPSCTLDFDLSVAFGYKPDGIEIERLVASDLPVDGLVCP
jgi:hypothetical protein